ncbi:MAG: hydroxymethylglutaryl-CoA lyase [Acidobacteriaceae bacterium]
MISDEIKIIECPRDAWQGLPKVIPADVKASYLRELIAAGFQHIDAVTFVSPKAVPQMADSEQVLRLLQAPEQIDIIGIVVNEKGAERAIATESVRTLGFPYSISPGFLERNQHQTPEESLDALDAIAELAYQAGVDLAVYLSMAFGNPYGDPWSLEEVVEGCSLLIEMGVQQISLADTIGIADPKRIASVVSAVLTTDDRVEFGVHLHARPEQAEEKVVAAYQAGCRRFDMAMGGLGGCPFAQDALVGNIATEQALLALLSTGAKLPELGSLTDLLARTHQISLEYGPPLQ